MHDGTDYLALIEEVVQDVTGSYDTTITADSTAGDVPGWDSLAHMNIIIGIEKKLNIRFTTGDLALLKTGDQTIGDLAALAAGKLDR